MHHIHKIILIPIIIFMIVPIIFNYIAVIYLLLKCRRPTTTSQDEVIDITFDSTETKDE